MANSETDISLPTIGMVDDLHPDNKDSKQYSFALNASVEDFDGNGFPMLQNHQSNILAVNFPEGFEINGKCPIPEQNRSIYFLLDASGHCQIGEVIGCQYDDTTADQPVNYECGGCILPMENVNTPLEKTIQTPYCSYREIIDFSCGNLSIDYPVDIEYRITDCGLNIYFTDGLNQRRYLYFNYLNANPRDGLVVQDHFLVVDGFTSGSCSQPIYGNTIDCNKIAYHPTYPDPCITLVDVISGGQLQAGVYQALFAYADENGNPLSQYFPATNPISIWTKPITLATNYVTDKAILFDVNNLDTTGLYSFYNIVIAATVDNFTSFILAGTFPTTIKTVTYTGDNATAPKLTPNDVFFQKPYYKTARGVTSANNYLFFTGLEEWNQPNMQPIANNIICYWETVAIPEPVYSDPKNVNRFRSYLRDEVYPLGIIFEFNEGDETCAFHIPGPSASYFQTKYGINVYQTVNNNDVVPDTTCEDLPRNAMWQVYNLGQVAGTPHNYTPNCVDSGCWEWGDFSYWESIETYPNDPTIWGNLCGQPIRFHKFPDSCVTHIHDSLNGSKQYTDKNIVYPIGIRVDHNSVLTALSNAVSSGLLSQDDYSRIKGYRIVRGNRVGNKSIVAKGLLFDMWSYGKFNRTYYYPNYPYNDLRNDHFISNDPNTYNTGNDTPPISNTFTPTGRYTFHSPDTSFVNPTIGTDLKLETLEYGTSEGYFNLCNNQAKYKLLSTASMTVALAAGIAAALSATTQKSCTTYTQTADFTDKQTTNGSIGSATLDAGITGTWAGETEGTLTSGTGTIGSHSIDAGTITQSHNNNTFTPYDPSSGQQLGIPVSVSSTTQTSCTGTTYQLLSPLSGSPVGFLLQQAIYQAMLGLREMQTVIDLLNSLIPYKNMAIQYNSVGRYNNYQCVANDTGNKIRQILTSAYLAPEVQIVDDSSDLAPSGTIYVNNWNRESSVYLRVDNTILLPEPDITDESRNTMGDYGLNYDSLNVMVQAPLSSYYASIKNFVPDQYGDIYNVEYLETNACSFALGDAAASGECSHVFGGDTFISRFGLKRKLPFFLQTAYKLNQEADIKYSDLGNVGYPNYYFNTPETLLERITGTGFNGNLLAIIDDLLNVPPSRLDVQTDKVFYQNGYIHLYNYGIPYFLVESDVDVDLRHGTDNLANDYYPHQQDLDFWLQEDNVPITEDNSYFYNTTYSKQNKESIVCINQPDFMPNTECKVNFPNRIIYSDPVVDYKLFDNWLVFKANNFFDFPLSNGTLISADGIENDKILVRFQNTAQIFAAYNTLDTSADQIQIGTGGIFSSRPAEFATTKLGYAGTQHRDLLQSEFGHVWIDAERGQIFHLQTGGGGLDEISKNGKKNWFKNNLPFQIYKDFPTMDVFDVDNNFKGIGIAMGYDKRFNRFYLTKLDYKVIDPAIKYDPVNKNFFYRDAEMNMIIVSVKDARYFCNKSWTMSYNFFTKSWVSYHTFYDAFQHDPNFYVDHIDHLETGYNNGHLSTLWAHGLTNKSYQVFGGNLFPFIVETQSTPGLQQKFLNSVEYTLDVLRYHNDYDWAYIRNVTFNKAIVFNQRQCSGLLELVIRDENDLSQIGEYPNVTDNKIQVLTTNSENRWNFNDFYDAGISQVNNLPLFLNNCANSFKQLNPKALDYFKPDLNKARIRSEYTQVRLINDKYSSYKFIFKWLDAPQTSTTR